MSWPLPLTPLASSHTQSRHCKNERFKRSQRRFIHWQTRIDPLWPWVIMPKHFSGIYPSTPCWRLLEGALHQWAKGDNNTCAFARVIHSLSHQVGLRECLRALSLSRLTVCADDSASFKQIIYYAGFNCQTGAWWYSFWPFSFIFSANNNEKALEEFHQ